MIAISPSFWARAFRKALREADMPEQKLADNLAAAIQRHAGAAHRLRIAESVSQELVHHHGGRWVVVETARPLTNALREKVRKAFSSKDYIEERVRPEIISGMRIIVDGEKEFDGSLKRKLDEVLI